MHRLFVVVSGLPASGKSTVARALAPSLGLSLLDKDEILEGLFESLGSGDSTERSRLSRASDTMLIRLAQQSAGAVITSFWQAPAIGTASGTPTDWIEHVPDATWVEVYCEVPPATAARRFLARTRHPGHLDSLRTLEDLCGQFERLHAAGPIGLEARVVVSTAGRVDFDSLAKQVVAGSGLAEPH